MDAWMDGETDKKRGITLMHTGMQLFSKVVYVIKKNTKLVGTDELLLN